MFTVYAIYNRNNKRIYIGQTVDIAKRIKEHNNPFNLTHQYTKRFSGDWKLIYSENAESRPEALKREKQLKSYQGRQFLKKHINRLIINKLSESAIAQR